MIFDVRLDNGVATLTCALEDYDNGVTYEREYVLARIMVTKEGEPPVLKLASGPWHASPFNNPCAEVPSWVSRLGKALEPRIDSMLRTGTPRDLRRWIDGELLKELEKKDEPTT